MQQFAGAMWHKIPFPTLQWLTGWSVLSLSLLSPTLSLHMSFLLSHFLCLPCFTPLTPSGSVTFALNCFQACFSPLLSCPFSPFSHSLFCLLLLLPPVSLSFYLSQPCFQMHPYSPANPLSSSSALTILTLVFLFLCLCLFPNLFFTCLYWDGFKSKNAVNKKLFSPHTVQVAHVADYIKNIPFIHQTAKIKMTTCDSGLLTSRGHGV